VSGGLALALLLAEAPVASSAPAPQDAQHYHSSARIHFVPPPAKALGALALSLLGDTLALSLLVARCRAVALRPPPPDGGKRQAAHTMQYRIELV
jgi:hypothetical protein